MQKDKFRLARLISIVIFTMFLPQIAFADMPVPNNQSALNLIGVKKVVVWVHTSYESSLKVLGVESLSSSFLDDLAQQIVEELKSSLNQNQKDNIELLTFQQYRGKTHIDPMKLTDDSILLFILGVGYENALVGEHTLHMGAFYPAVYRALPDQIKDQSRVSGFSKRFTMSSVPTPFLINEKIKKEEGSLNRALNESVATFVLYLNQ